MDLTIFLTAIKRIVAELSIYKMCRAETSFGTESISCGHQVTCMVRVSMMEKMPRSNFSVVEFYVLFSFFILGFVVIRIV